MICKVQKCLIHIKALGYCCKHYQQIRRVGKILNRTKFDPNQFTFTNNTCLIRLSDNKGDFIGTAIVDAKYYLKIKNYKWHLSADGYAVTTMARANNLTYRLHWVSTGKPAKGKSIDHINGNKLDNRKVNLRRCSISENSFNRGASVNNKYGYKNIYRHKTRDCWIVELCKEGKRRYCKGFKTIKDAIEARNYYAKKIQGEFAHASCC